MWKCLVRLVCLSTLLALSLLLPSLHAAQEVRVGAYHFPPYVMRPEQVEAAGLIVELLGVLNQVQGQYRFVLTPTSTKRRYRDLRDGRYDLILFESPEWGWQGTPHVALNLHLEDAEVYVALHAPGRGQDYFDSLQGKRIALYNGYHYGFAGFNADQQFLAREFDALLTYSHDSNLGMILRQRAEIAVITRSYLNMYLQRHPAQAKAFLISERVDQVYRHQALFGLQAAITPAVFAGLLAQLRARGELDELFARYHLQQPTVLVAD